METKSFRARLFMDHITESFCILDDFCKEFNQSLEKALISDHLPDTIQRKLV